MPQPPSSMDKSYKLSTEDHEAIYNNKIAPYYLPRSKPQEHPCAIITGGQPGAGKSGLTDTAIARFRESGYVLVDADKVRPFHPQYDILMEVNDKTAADLTHGDTAAWSNRLMRDGVAGRRNLIVDQTSRDPVAMTELTQNLRKEGYHIELHVMAVSSDVSLLRIDERYEKQRKVHGHGRFSNKDKHDAAYPGVADTVASVEAGRQVDRLCLYDFNLKPIYENQLKDGQWQRDPLARSGLDGERSRLMTPAEALDHVHKCNELVSVMEQRNDPQEKDALAARRERYQKAVTQVATIQSLKEIEGVARELQTQPLPGGLSAVVERADPQARKPYSGKILATTEHHALQQIGANKFIIHDKAGAPELTVGKCATIAYGQAKDAPLGKPKDKGLQR